MCAVCTSRSSCLAIGVLDKKRSVISVPNRRQSFVPAACRLEQQHCISRTCDRPEVVADPVSGSHHKSGTGDTLKEDKHGGLELVMDL